MNPAKPQPPHRRLPLRLTIFVSAAVALTLVIVIAAVIGTLGRGNERPEASVSPAVEEPVEETSEPPRALLATVTHFGRGDDDCNNFVFDASSAAAADEIFEGTTYLTPAGDFTGPVMSAGGYVTEGVEIYVNLQSDMPQQVTVFNIRAEILERDEPITGGTYISTFPCAGTEIDRMRLFLNSPEPGPFLLTEEGGLTDQLFFDDQVIHVAPGEKQSIQIDADLDYELEGGAYEFQLVIDYELDGEIMSAIVDNNGEPFRVASTECPHERYFGIPTGSDLMTETEFRLVTAEELEYVCLPIEYPYSPLHRKSAQSAYHSVESDVALFVTGSQVRQLQHEVRTLTEEQRRTNALLAQLLERYDTAAQHQRVSAENATRFNGHLSTTALAVAMVSFVVGLMSVFAALPASPVSYIGIIAAGLVVIMFLSVAIRHAMASWRLRHHLDKDDAAEDVADPRP